MKKLIDYRSDEILDHIKHKHKHKKTTIAELLKIFKITYHSIHTILHLLQSKGKIKIEQDKRTPGKILYIYYNYDKNNK